VQRIEVKRRVRVLSPGAAEQRADAVDTRKHRCAENDRIAAETTDLRPLLLEAAHQLFGNRDLRVRERNFSRLAEGFLQRQLHHLAAERVVRVKDLAGVISGRSPRDNFIYNQQVPELRGEARTGIAPHA